MNQVKTITMTLPPPVVYVMNRLEDAGYTAYAVGGCVRDHLMGRTPGDYDVTTSAKPEEMSAVFAGDRVVETGLKHGTLTIVKDGMNVETTTYRIDGAYDDGRHPDSVTFTDRLEDDLCRRDFTINAMAYHPVRGIVDLWDGMGDLARKSVRCVGDARERFSEDGLRILRALRFSSVLDFTPDEACAAGVRELCPLLGKISRERIYTECTKLLCGCGASRILDAFPEIIAFVIPGLDDAGVKEAAARIRLDEALVRSGYAVLPELRYALLLSSVVGWRDAVNSLKPSRDEKNAVLAFESHRMSGDLGTSLGIKRLMGQVGDDFPVKLARYRYLCGELGMAELVHAESLADEILAEDACRRVSQLKADGQDLMDLGFRGREIGDVLKHLLAGVMSGDCENEKKALLERAKHWKIGK